MRISGYVSFFLYMFAVQKIYVPQHIFYDPLVQIYELIQNTKKNIRTPQ